MEARMRLRGGGRMRTPTGCVSCFCRELFRRQAVEVKKPCGYGTGHIR